MPLTLPKLYLRTESAVLCRPSAESERVLEGSGFGMVSRRRCCACNRGKRASSLLSPTHAAVRTKGVRGNAGALGESRACGLALCGFCGGEGYISFLWRRGFRFFAAECGRLGRAAAQGAAAMAFGGAAQRLVRGVIIIIIIIIIIIVVVVVVVLAGRVRRWT